MRRTILFLLIFAPAAQALAAPVKSNSSMGIEFEKLSATRYVLSHEEEGARSIKIGQMKLASICIAAGGTHFETVRRTKDALEFEVHAEAAPGREDCAAFADPKMVKRAAKRLAKVEKRAAAPTK